MTHDPQVIQYRPGLTAFTSPRGVRVLVLRLGADPADTPEWINAQRPLYTAKKWRREMEGDWTSPAGESYFPEFAVVGQEKYVHVVRRLIKAPVVRSLDFGRRKPACTWFQYSERSDRLWLYREFMPAEIGTHAFRDAVRVLSGELTVEDVPVEFREQVQRWVEAYAAKPGGQHCPPPWFPPGTRFINVAGKEALQRQANAIRPEDAVAADIFAAGGMPLVICNPEVVDRNLVVDRLLGLRSDGWPGLLIDPQCEEMLEGFAGAFSYPPATKAVPTPTKPRDDGHYINLLDAFGYGVSAAVPKDPPKPRPPGKLIGYDGREPVYAEPEGESVGWSETRMGRLR